eukprot:Phypoly_transcript_18249.p1 GENE.Phypoly_transcript_18249~~Phypoly_transcript_18249.p1  ORF type:complete len:151 (+),score=28.36 Phypoly_transcript_18249:221-673(+)
MDRKEVTLLLKEGKRNTNITYHDLAQQLGKPKVWLTAAIHGQHPFQEADAIKLLEILGITEHKEKIVRILKEAPYRGEEVTKLPPTDPTLYRMYEFLQIYGPSLKELIHEEFGDGIMSAINANVDLRKVSSPEGDRVQIILEGKFLAYKW